RVRPPLATARSTSVDARADPSAGNASKAGSRHAALHLASRKNRRSSAQAFLPSRWGGRKFQSCARRRKKFLQSSSRGSPTPDTSCRKVGAVPSLSYAFNLHCVATVAGTANVNESSFRPLQEPFNHGFGFFSIRHLGSNHLVLRIVSAEH